MKKIVCDRCGKDLTDESTAFGVFTTPRKLAIMLTPNKTDECLPMQSIRYMVDLCEECDKAIYETIFNKEQSEK